jgi:hypothetical protein
MQLYFQPSLEEGVRISDPLWLELNQMNGGLKIPVLCRHTFPAAFYGRPGTYGTNTFKVELHLKIKSARIAKLDEVRLFFPEALEVNYQPETGVQITLPADKTFDGRHSLAETLAYFQAKMPTINHLAEYLQAQQVY